MRITHEQWQRLEHLAKVASEAVNNLEHQFLMIACDHHYAGSPEGNLMVELAARHSGPAVDALAGLTYFLHPQPEWTGGPSDDPKNFKLREPHAVTLPLIKTGKGERLQARPEYLEPDVEPIGWDCAECGAERPELRQHEPCPKCGKTNLEGK